MEKATNAFIQWLEGKKVVISPKITIADLSDKNQGRGIVATEDIESGETLFEIPQTSILNVETSSLAQDFPEFKDKLVELGQWEALILVFAYEWLVKGESSEWNNYFDVLPIKEKSYTFNQLIFWDDEELKSLEPSLILQRVGKDKAKEMYAALQDLITENKLNIDLSFEDFQKLATTVMSYSFDVQVGGDDEDDDEDDDEPSMKNGFFKSMVPLADTLNADTEFQNANLVYTENSLVMTSTKKINKDEQVYNTYSDLPNSEILRRYGYVQDHGSNFDFAEIPLDMIKKYFSGSGKISSEIIDRFIDHISKIVDDENTANDYDDKVDLILDSYDVYITKDVQTELIFLVQLLTIVVAMQSTITTSENELAAIKRIYKKCYQLLESQKLTQEFKLNYENIVKDRINQYPEQINNETSARYGMAQTVLSSEVSSLKECQDTSKVMANYKFIDDLKLIRNIDKKRSNDVQSITSSKRRNIGDD